MPCKDGKVVGTIEHVDDSTLNLLFEVTTDAGDEILIPAPVQLHRIGEQQASACCSNHLSGHFGYGKSPMQLQPFAPFALLAA